MAAAAAPPSTGKIPPRAVPQRGMRQARPISIP
ncbi:hypothetical protein A3768_2487 [Ralstonia solanacearum]|nr:hypothetical protein A3768_2487 [Ralstonia solanacearum]